MAAGLAAPAPGAGTHRPGQGDRQPGHGPGLARRQGALRRRRVPPAPPLPPAAHRPRPAARRAGAPGLRLHGGHLQRRTRRRAPDRLPLPGLHRLVTAAEAEPDTDRLAVLLGRTRAGILRHARRRPSAPDTARHVGVSVSTASYHCDQLTEAGLLQRRRHGQQVRLYLTDEGAALMDLPA
nr:winged helix-turn-helix domain-containing protein [Streptomyces sp. Tu 3180]